MEIQSIRFKREKQDPWEKGLCIQSWDSESERTNIVIVDIKARVITKDIWDIEYDYDLLIRYQGAGSD